MTKNRGKIIIPGNTAPWPHEMQIAKVLSDAGYIVEFIPTSNIRTADAKINGTEFELKSPKSSKANSLEHLLKKALKQAVNIVISSARLSGINDAQLHSFLTRQAKNRKQIKRLIFITKSGIIIDIK